MDCWNLLAYSSPEQWEKKHGLAQRKAKGSAESEISEAAAVDVSMLRACDVVNDVLLRTSLC